jgi:shikimate kinase
VTQQPVPLVVVMGVSGAGKTEVGRQLAAYRSQ